MSVSAEQIEHAVTRAGKVFAIIRHAAEQGQSCPTNADLAGRFGVSPQRITAALEFLEANGMIQVERGQNHRVVTIRASGLKTAGTVRVAHSPRKAA